MYDRRARLRRVVLFAYLLVFSVAAPATAVLPPVVIDTCGAVLTGDGILSGDLNCTGETEVPVTIESGTLDLAGFQLINGDASVAVLCNGSCSVLSSAPGGAVIGGGVRGFVSVTIRDVTVTDALTTGVFSSGRVRVINSFVLNSGTEGVLAATFKIENSEIRNNLGDGVGSLFSPRTKLRMKDSIIDGNGGRGVYVSGSLKQVAKITDSQVTGNGDIGVVASATGAVRGKVKAFDTIVSGNAGHGVVARNVTVKRGEVSNNGGIGISGEFRRTGVVQDTVVTGNGLSGIQGDTDCPGNDRKPSRVKLRGTTNAFGNATSVDCGVTETCADVSSCGTPKLAPTVSCETSYMIGSGLPGVSWGVCALD